VPKISYGFLTAIAVEWEQAQCFRSPHSLVLEVAVTVLRFDPFGDPFRQMDRLTNQLLSGTRTPMGMPMDVWQTDDGFHVCLDLPGVDPDSVDITTERNILTVTAERRAEYQQGQNVLIAERPQGTFTRQLQLGDTVDVENIQASYGDGVLHLTLPITQAAQPRRVQVRTDDSGQRKVTVEGETEESAPASGATTDSGTQGTGGS
jgi:HSP20 family protein